MEFTWRLDSSTESRVQIQYRLLQARTPWTTDNQFYNHSINTAVVANLQPEQSYKFRLVVFDSHGEQIMTSPIKRLSLKLLNHLPVPQITDAWVTSDGLVSLKWKLNDSNLEAIDGFIIYYRSLNSNQNNYTKITVPNLRYPLIDTYTIPSIESDNKYELRMTTYSNRGVSAMSNSIEIAIPSCKSPSSEDDSSTAILSSSVHTTPFSDQSEESRRNSREYNEDPESDAYPSRSRHARSSKSCRIKSEKLRYVVFNDRNHRRDLIDSRRHSHRHVCLTNTSTKEIHR